MPAGVVGVDDDEYIELRNCRVDVFRGEWCDLMPGDLPSGGVFGVARRNHADAAGWAQLWQGLNRSLRARDGQDVLAAVVALCRFTGRRRLRAGVATTRTAGRESASRWG